MVQGILILFITNNNLSATYYGLVAATTVRGFFYGIFERILC